VADRVTGERLHLQSDTARVVGARPDSLEEYPGFARGRRNASSSSPGVPIERRMGMR
jgi:hypothetical protein